MQQETELGYPAYHLNMSDNGEYMLALRFSSSKGLEKVVTKVPTLDDYDDHILLKVLYCGICGTDIDILKGLIKINENCILGHEFSGTIFKLGKNVSKNMSDKYPIGANAVVMPCYMCTKCDNCRNGYPNFCSSQYGSLESCLGLGMDGGLAHYVRCHYRQCYLFNSNKLPINIAPLVEPFHCIVSGFDKFMQIKSNHIIKKNSNSKNDNILIIGFGTIGYLWSLIFYENGFKNIYVCEKSRKRQEIAQKCDHIKAVLMYGDDNNELILNDSERNINISSFDVAIDCAGGTTEPLSMGYKLLGIGGALISFGLFDKNDTLTIKPCDFTWKEISIIGTIAGKIGSMEKAINKMESFVANGIMDPKMLKENNIIEFFHFNKYKSAINAIDNGDACKVIIDVSTIGSGDSKL